MLKRKPTRIELKPEDAQEYEDMRKRLLAAKKKELEKQNIPQPIINDNTTSINERIGFVKK